MEEEEKQLQEGQEEKYKSFLDTRTGIPRREASGRGIDHIEPTKGGKLHETNTGTHFPKSRNTKEIYGLKSTKRQQLILVSLR